MLRFVFLFFHFILAGLAFSAEVDVYLLSGQSNM